MFRYYETRPAQLRYYGASDFAVTNNGGDYTVHGVFGVDPVGNIYVVAWWRGQTTSDIWIDELLAMADKWKTVKWFGESGVIRRSIEPYLRKRQQERGKYISMDWLSSVSDKPTRARSIQGRIAQGMLYLPAGQDWAEALVSQCLRFPNTDDDDDVDVLSLLGRGVDSMLNATPEILKTKKSAQPGSIEWLMANSQEPKKVSPYR
jgi:predicted phage terminase large subunit-like protein